MEPILRSLILKRFRSIPAETVQFANPTFLVGRNGSGKSNFCDALHFLAEAMSSSLQSVVERRGGILVVRNRTPGKDFPRNVGLAVLLGRFACRGSFWNVSEPTIQHESRNLSRRACREAFEL
jgi:predicted ATPase